MPSHRFSVFLVYGLIASAPAASQTNNDSHGDLDTIVITASRSPLARGNIGSSTTVITHDLIEKRQARYVTDLLRAIPGFSVSQTGTTGTQTQVRVRGAEANHVLVLIDGVRANDPATGDEFRWEQLSTSNVERIEIVRGPQSSLWGSDAIAAVVHIITRSGGDNTKLGSYIEGGTNNTLNAGLQGSIGGEQWSVAYGLERQDTDGSNISRSGDENDESDLTTASVSGKYRPTDQLALNFGVRMVDAYSQFDPVDFFTTGLPTDGDRATESTQATLHSGATVSTLDGRVVHKLTARYLDTSNDNLVDGVQTSSSQSDRTSLIYQADIQLDRNLLSLAAENEQTRFEQRGTIGFGDPNQNQKTSVNSIAADFQGKSVDHLTWLLSARYDNYSDFDNTITGRLALAYKLSDTTLIRTSIGTGQKTPTFTERFGFFPGQFVGNPDLKPEESTSYEIGIEQLFLDGALDLEISIFSQDLENEINGFIFDPDTFSFTAANMGGKSSRKGAEISAMFTVVTNLELGASYTYTDSTEPDVQGNNVKELRRPQHTGSLNANYRFLNNQANLYLAADYGGSRNDIFFPPFPAPSEIVELNSYWLVDLTASYNISRRINVFVRATNLLDENYEQVFGYQTNGRAGYLGIRVNFDEW